jgi:hypothetical protein
MPNLQTIELDGKGKCKIKQVKSIATAFPILPEEIEIQDALRFIESVVQKEADSANCSIHQGAFNNVRGEWFELFLNSRFYNLSKKSKRFCIFSIPNVNSTPFVRFFNVEVGERLRELESSLQKQGIELQMSNPDFLCVDLAKIDPSVATAVLKHPAITSLDESSADFLNNLYKAFIGNCSFDSIKFAVSAKTSVRPDRRYQFVHEGNIIKAFTAHLQTRFWRNDFEIKYFAIMNEKPTDADQEVLKTAAISSITNVFANSIRAVDGIFWIKKLSDIDKFVKQALG